LDLYKLLIISLNFANYLKLDQAITLIKQRDKRALMFEISSEMMTA